MRLHRFEFVGVDLDSFDCCLSEDDDVAAAEEGEEQDDLYALLNANPGCSARVLKQQWKLLSLLHPDKHVARPNKTSTSSAGALITDAQVAAADAFLRVRAAYDVLGAADKRMAYDEHGAAGVRAIRDSRDIATSLFSPATVRAAVARVVADQTQREHSRRHPHSSPHVTSSGGGIIFLLAPHLCTYGNVADRRRRARHGGGGGRGSWLPSLNLRTQPPQCALMRVSQQVTIKATSRDAVTVATEMQVHGDKGAATHAANQEVSLGWTRQFNEATSATATATASKGDVDEQEIEVSMRRQVDENTSVDVTLTQAGFDLQAPVAATAQSRRQLSDAATATLTYSLDAERASSVRALATYKFVVQL
jgi:hypothetical protein